MLEYGKSGIYNNNRLLAEKEKKENTRDRSVPDGSDNYLSQPCILVYTLNKYHVNLIGTDFIEMGLHVFESHC